MFVKAKKTGDALELLVQSEGMSRAKLVLHATKSDDYGVLILSVNGHAAVSDLDLYSPKPVPSGPIELGTFESGNGGYRLRAQVTGMNPNSNGVFFGLDCVTLHAAD